MEPFSSGNPDGFLFDILQKNNFVFLYLYSIFINIFIYGKWILFYAHPFLRLLFHLFFHQLSISPAKLKYEL